MIPGTYNPPMSTGAKTVEFLSHQSSSANQSTYTFTDVDFGPDDPTREIIVIAVFTSGSAAVNSLTVGGVSEYPGSNPGGTFWRVYTPRGTSGDIEIELSAGATNMFIGVYRVTNRARLGAPSFGQTSYQYSAGTSDADSVSTPAGGFALLFFNKTGTSQPTFTGDFIIDANISMESARWVVGHTDIITEADNSSWSATWSSNSTVLAVAESYR